MFRIRFVQEDLQRIIFASHKIESTAEIQINDVPFYCAQDFVALIRRNIMTQKHMGGYAALNPRYKSWKEQYGRSGREYWALFGDLVNNLVTFRPRARSRWISRWQGGIPAGVMDSGGKSWFGRGDFGPSKPIALYGGWMEWGRKGQPPRPLFEPTTEEYITTGKWAERGEAGLRKIKFSWS